MRKITEIIIHCSATPEGRDYTVADIDRWHRERGYRRIGYHFVVYRDGSVHEGRPVEDVGAHCIGHNRASIGICYIGGLSSPSKGDRGGLPKDTRTPEQRQALRTLVERLRADYPGVTLHGHNHFAHKACPCFNVPQDL